MGRVDLTDKIGPKRQRPAPAPKPKPTATVNGRTVPTTVPSAVIQHHDDEPSERAPVKFTANLKAAEYDQLEEVTAEVVRALNPWPIGKGWRAEVVRTLIRIASDDPELRERVIQALRDAG